jgi:hypothetical protein
MLYAEKFPDPAKNRERATILDFPTDSSARTCAVLEMIKKRYWSGNRSYFNDIRGHNHRPRTEGGLV